MISVSYRLHDSESPAAGPRVEVVTGLVDEYGTRLGGGGYQTWDTSPRSEEIYPLAKRIEHARRDHGGAYRRRVIVVEEWTEVDAP